jgi:hypothetical protein
MNKGWLGSLGLLGLGGVVLMLVGGTLAGLMQDGPSIRTAPRAERASGRLEARRHADLEQRARPVEPLGLTEPEADPPDDDIRRSQLTAWQVLSLQDPQRASAVKDAVLDALQASVGGKAAPLRILADCHRRHPDGPATFRIAAHVEVHEAVLRLAGWTCLRPQPADAALCHCTVDRLPGELTLTAAELVDFDWSGEITLDM